jgi:stage IV sporulation protein FB
MSDLFSWSIDLGRWAGSRLRVHWSLVLFAALALLGGATAETPRFWPTLGWLAVLFVVLILHEMGHLAAAAWKEADAEDVMLWPLGSLVGPSRARSHENPWVAAGGLFVSGALAAVTFVALRMLGAGMVVDPFGKWPDSGAPLILGTEGRFAPMTPIWYLGWFGWLNWVVFLANLLLPALPFDMGRIVRATIARPVFGESRDAMIAPWLAHVAAILLALIGGLRLVLYRRADSLTLIMLALLIEIFVRAEARLMEEGSFFDDGVFGYDFSEGYTSLEASTAKVRPHRESALKRWRRRRSDQRKQRLQAQFAADDRRLDEILDKLHRQGKASLTDEENRFLVRVSAKIKKRPKDRD